MKPEKMKSTNNKKKGIAISYIDNGIFEQRKDIAL